MATDILPVPVNAEAEAATAVDKAELLKKHERNIRANFVKFQKVQQSVARSLNIIYHNDLWKLHLDENGKRKYTNFDVYLEDEFGWDKTAARARQIMKGDLPLAIEAGEVPAEAGDKRRTRTAPEVTPAKAATVTAKQLTTVLDAWNTRMDTVEEGTGKGALIQLHQDAVVAITTIIDDLTQLAAELNAEAETAPTDDESDDEADDESDES